MDRTEDRCPDPRIIRRFSSTQLIPGAPSAGPLMSSRVADDYKHPKAADALISTNSRRVCVPVPTLAVYLSINSADPATNGAISAHVGSATLVPQPLSSDRSHTQPRQKGKSATDRPSRLNSQPGRARRDHRQPDDGGSTTSGIRCGELTRSIPTFITDVTFRLTPVRQLGACGPEESLGCSSADRRPWAFSVVHQTHPRKQFAVIWVSGRCAASFELAHFGLGRGAGGLGWRWSRHRSQLRAARGRSSRDAAGWRSHPRQGPLGPPLCDRLVVRSAASDWPRNAGLSTACPQ